MHLYLLTPDLVLEPVGHVVAEDDAVAELEGRRPPGDADTARGERVTLDKLGGGAGHCNVQCENGEAAKLSELG